LKASVNKVKIFLMPEKSQARESYHPVHHMIKVLEKESKNFIYKGGYRKIYKNLQIDEKPYKPISNINKVSHL